MKWNIINIDECVSTNLYVRELRKTGKLTDRTAIVTKFQSMGRGQRQNSWNSEKGSNLLVSLYKNTDIYAEDNFIITIITSLALSNAIKLQGVECKIKWPNDIYVKDNKIAGILIENSLFKNIISDTIIGIGLNVNQKSFPKELPNPISLYQVLDKKIDIDHILIDLIKEIDKLLEQAKDNFSALYHEYISRLYRLKSWNLYRTDGNTFNGKIHGVETDGRLILENGMGDLKHYLFGEINYML